MNLPVNEEPHAGSQCPPPARLKSANDGIAIASVSLGGMGVVAYLILSVAALTMTSTTNRDSLAGVAADMGATLNVLPFAILVLLANCLGMILSGVALCRKDGRELGLLGLLLNTVPVPVFFGFLSSILPQPQH